MLFLILKLRLDSKPKIICSRDRQRFTDAKIAGDAYVISEVFSFIEAGEVRCVCVLIHVVHQHHPG